MAIREGNSSNNDWVQFYQRNLSNHPTGGGGGEGGGVVFGRTSPMTESTVVTTTTTSAASPAGAGGDRPQPVSEGRVGKAARRRSRASRKAPTTVLNTDTTNFRAMVQQFTGVPSRPFPAGYPHMTDGGGGPATLSFGVAGGASQIHHQQAVFPFGVQQEQQYQQYSQFQQHHERPLFTLGGGSGRGNAGPGDIYLRGLGGGNSQRSSMGAPEGLLLNSISSSQNQMMPRPATSTGSTTTDGFLL